MCNFGKNIKMKTFIRTVIIIFFFLFNLNILLSQNITDSIRVYIKVNKYPSKWKQDPSEWHPETSNYINKVITDKKDIQIIEKRLSKIKLKKIKYFTSLIKCIAYSNGKESYYFIIASQYYIYKDAKYYKSDNKINRILSRYLSKDEFRPRRCFLIRAIQRGFYSIFPNGL